LPRESLTFLQLVQKAVQSGDVTGARRVLASLHVGFATGAADTLAAQGGLVTLLPAVMSLLRTEQERCLVANANEQHVAILLIMAGLVADRRMPVEALSDGLLASALSALVHRPPNILRAGGAAAALQQGDVGQGSGGASYGGPGASDAGAGAGSGGSAMAVDGGQSDGKGGGKASSQSTAWWLRSPSDIAAAAKARVAAWRGMATQISLRQQAAALLVAVLGRIVDAVPRIRHEVAGELVHTLLAPAADAVECINANTPELAEERAELQRFAQALARRHPALASLLAVPAASTTAGRLRRALGAGAHDAAAGDALAGDSSAGGSLLVPAPGPGCFGSLIGLSVCGRDTLQALFLPLHMRLMAVWARGAAAAMQARSARLIAAASARRAAGGKAAPLTAWAAEEEAAVSDWWYAVCMHAMQGVAAYARSGVRDTPASKAPAGAAAASGGDTASSVSRGWQLEAAGPSKAAGGTRSPAFRGRAGERLIQVRLVAAGSRRLARSSSRGGGNIVSSLPLSPPPAAAASSFGPGPGRSPSPPAQLGSSRAPGAAASNGALGPKTGAKRSRRDLDAAEAADAGAADVESGRTSAAGGAGPDVRAPSAALQASPPPAADALEPGEGGRARKLPRLDASPPRGLPAPAALTASGGPRESPSHDGRASESHLTDDAAAAMAGLLEGKSHLPSGSPLPREEAMADGGPAVEAADAAMLADAAAMAEAAAAAAASNAAGRDDDDGDTASKAGEGGGDDDEADGRSELDHLDRDRRDEEEEEGGLEDGAGATTDAGESMLDEEASRPAAARGGRGRGRGRGRGGRGRGRGGAKRGSPGRRGRGGSRLGGGGGDGVSDSERDVGESDEGEEGEAEEHHGDGEEGAGDDSDTATGTSRGRGRGRGRGGRGRPSAGGGGGDGGRRISNRQAQKEAAVEAQRRAAEEDGRRRADDKERKRRDAEARRKSKPGSGLPNPTPTASSGGEGKGFSADAAAAGALALLAASATGGSSLDASGPPAPLLPATVTVTSSSGIASATISLEAVPGTVAAAEAVAAAAAAAASAVADAAETSYQRLLSTADFIRSLATRARVAPAAPADTAGRHVAPAAGASAGVAPHKALVLSRSIPTMQRAPVLIGWLDSGEEGVFFARPSPADIVLI
jgi:hypothetical protein